MAPVLPVAAAAPAKHQAGDAKAGAEITFVGYQAQPSGAGLLFVEMTESVTVEEQRSGQRLEYRLIGAQVPLRNNTNPLLLSEFGSSAISAQLVRDKAKRGKPPSVRLVVNLRSDIKPTHRVVQRGKGAALEIQLPAASAAPAAPAPAK
jgi:hypothetical protein